MSQPGRLSKDQIFAKLVLQHKLASIDQINACINKQRDLRGSGERLRLHEVMVSEGLVDADKAEELAAIDLEPLSCPRCELRYYYPDFDPEQTYTCPRCSGVLVVERERRITGQIKRGVTAQAEAPPAAKEPEPPATARPSPTTNTPSSSGVAKLAGHMDSGVMPLLDANSQSTDSQVVLPTVGGPRGSEDAIEIVLPEVKEDALCGTTVGGYRILKKLGQGGMGVIYKAEQVSLKRIVALKMLAQRLAADANYVSRFVHEARSVAKVNHANIVQIYDVGQDGKYCYFSMEYVEGENVGSILDRLVKIPSKLALDLTTQVAEALQAANSNGIVHRDIKPDNIILSRNGTAKLADLGIAKTSDLTEQFQRGSGVQIGTPYYISPEQASDPSGVDIRADIYSLGASYFHMVTGQFPYSGATPMMILMKLANDPTPKAHEVNPQVPFPVSRTIQKMMAKSPDDRYQTPDELVAALEELKSELNDTGKSQRRKASLVLQQRELMRIEPTSSPARDLVLADDVKKPAARTKTRVDGDTSGMRRPPPPRATTSKVPRAAPPAPSPAASPRAQQLAIQIAIGAVVLVVAFIAYSIITGSSRPPDPIPDVPSHDPVPGPGKITPPPGVTRSPAEEEWDALVRIPIAELRDPELVEHDDKLAAFAARSDAGSLADKARVRRGEVALERANRDWRTVEKDLEPLLRGTFEVKDFGKAETLLKAAAERLPKGHLKEDEAKARLEAVRSQSRTRTEDLLNRARARPEPDLPQAKADLEEAAPRLASACREMVLAEIASIDKRIALGTLKRHHESRMLVWSAAASDLWYHEYATAADKARERVKSTRPDPDVDLEAEAAEIAALAQLWQALKTKLEATKGNVTLQFYDDPAPVRVEVTGLSSLNQIIFASGGPPRSITELHADEVLRLIDPVVKAAGAVGKLRVALLLVTFGQYDEGIARLDKWAADGAEVAFLRRAMSFHAARLVEIDSGSPKKPEQLMWVAIHLHQLDKSFARCPETALLEPIRARWRECFLANTGGIADALVEQINVRKRTRKRLEWQSLARAVIALCPSATEAVRKAEEMLKKID